MNVQLLTIGSDSELELENILNHTFAPLSGFMGEADYRGVVDNCRLVNGSVWTMPISLEVPEQDLAQIRNSEVVRLVSETGRELANLYVEDVYRVNFATDLSRVFKVDQIEHPGVKKEISRSPFRVGGKVERLASLLPDNEFPYYSPEASKQYFKQAGWKKVTGFQTRNPLHRAHEYLHRIALEVSDGLFIQPLLGWKKSGDFTAEAVFAGYRKMLEDFYPHNRVLLGSLRTAMRYAGPREAVFHALVRRNHGCTHFIVGRDHAGVGGYYGKYEAQDFALSFDDLGIEILPLCGPFYCRHCGGIVTEKTCGHSGAGIEDVSGTNMRAEFSAGRLPAAEYMRKEISEVLLALEKKDRLIYA